MSNLSKYHSIEQFRHTAKQAKSAWFKGYHPRLLKFTGTVKLHGSNAGIRLSKDGYICQSRNRNLGPEDADNATFRFNMDQHTTYINTLQDNLCKAYDAEFEDVFVVYGEWCGQGIQKNVAISELSKRLIIFDIKHITEDGKEVWLSDWQHLLPSDNEDMFWNIYEFPTYELELDCNYPDGVVEQLTELVEAVEAECPVAKRFGVSGIGEGIVWTHTGETVVVDVEYVNGAGVTVTEPKEFTVRYVFKTKGQKHDSTGSATKLKVQLTPEQLETQTDFIKAVLTESRLNQGIQYLEEMGHEVCMKSFGHYIKWVMADVVKEEYDVMIANGIDNKTVGKILPNHIRQWFMEKHG